MGKRTEVNKVNSLFLVDRSVNIFHVSRVRFYVSIFFLVTTFFNNFVLHADDSQVTISIDDLAGLNTETNTNNLEISVTENGLGLILGPGSSISGWDAYGTGTSKFGQTGEWFDGSYVKFGNVSNQQILDFRITNNLSLIHI